jgi:hypothetical protein
MLERPARDKHPGLLLPKICIFYNTFEASTTKAATSHTTATTTATATILKLGIAAITASTTLTPTSTASLAQFVSN